MTQIRICDKCIFFEPFGTPGKDKMFNKCALLDIWNIEECPQCNSFKPEKPPLNTKERSAEIYQAALAAVIAAGGVAYIDHLEQTDRLKLIRSLVKQTMAAVNCSINPAKQSIAKAMRRERYEIVKSWGGKREGAGRPPNEEAENGVA